MKVAGVIPARYGSTRFPGKPLALILGKPLLQWVIEGALKSKKLKTVLVATDDHRIAELAKTLKVEVVMTDSNLATGSDRVWAAIQDRDFDAVINIQGDEPLIEGQLLDRMVQALEESPSTDMLTLGRKISGEELLNPQIVKIILNQNQEALYFSRFPIPYSRLKFAEEADGCLKHIGMYAYKKDFLRRFCEQGPVSIERAESLEQLRALYLGAKIKVLEVLDDSWGVDLVEDIEKVELKMKEKQK